MKKRPRLLLSPLWHCFGCDTGGDVIRFVELMDKVSFPEAFKRLAGDQMASSVADTNKPTVSKKSSSLTAASDLLIINPTQRTKTKRVSLD